jgi:hypothetical protein
VAAVPYLVGRKIRQGPIDDVLFFRLNVFIRSFIINQAMLPCHVGLEDFLISYKPANALYIFSSL